MYKSFQKHAIKIPWPHATSPRYPPMILYCPWPDDCVPLLPLPEPELLPFVVDSFYRNLDRFELETDRFTRNILPRNSSQSSFQCLIIIGTYNIRFYIMNISTFPLNLILHGGTRLVRFPSTTIYTYSSYSSIKIIRLR